jgi:hypothetical protein
LWRADWSTQELPAATMDRNWQAARCEQEKDRDAGPLRAQHEPSRVHPRSAVSYLLVRSYESLRTEICSALFALFATTGYHSRKSGFKTRRSNRTPRLIARLSPIIPTKYPDIASYYAIAISRKILYTVGYARTNVIGVITSFVIASVRSSIH